MLTDSMDLYVGCCQICMSHGESAWNECARVPAVSVVFTLSPVCHLSVLWPLVFVCIVCLWLVSDSNTITQVFQTGSQSHYVRDLHSRSVWQTNSPTLGHRFLPAHGDSDQASPWQQHQQQVMCGSCGTATDLQAEKENTEIDLTSMFQRNSKSNNNNKKKRKKKKTDGCHCIKL